MPSLMVSLFMGAIILPFKYLNTNDFLLLFVQIFVGVLAYIAFSKIFKIKSYHYILTTIADLFKKIREKTPLK